jgi:hypothetical protein
MASSDPEYHEILLRLADAGVEVIRKRGSAE